jgi:hypothetical protein
MYTGKITIKETTESDLENIKSLWNNGEVMFFVGFPGGKVNRVYVEPSPANKKAWALYGKLGFVSKPRPTYLEDEDTYLGLTKDE